MKTKVQGWIQFGIGGGCVVASVIGAFYSLPCFYFIVMFGGGCGLMGQRSVWEKIASILRDISADRSGRPQR